MATSCRDLILPPLNENDPNGYYAELGLEPWASPQDIKSAYRRLTRVLHPDGSDPEPERFLYVQHIFDTLMDPSAKWDYDHAEGMYLSWWELETLRRENPDLMDQLDKLDEAPSDEELEMLTAIHEAARLNAEHYTFYGDVDHEETAQEWVRCFLEALWADGKTQLVRVGVREQEEGILVRKTPGLKVYFFRPEIQPNPFIAYWALNKL